MIFCYNVLWFLILSHDNWLVLTSSMMFWVCEYSTWRKGLYIRSFPLQNGESLPRSSRHPV